MNEELKLSNQFIGAIMISLQHSLAEAERGNYIDLTETYQGWRVGYDEHGDLLVLNPPAYMVHISEFMEEDEDLA